MARIPGTFNVSFNLEPQIKGPLDARMLVDSYADLTGFTAGNYLKNGFIVSVFDADVSKRGVYQLIDENNLGATASWMFIGANSGGSGNQGRQGPQGPSGIDGVVGGQIYYFNQSVAGYTGSYKKLSNSPISSTEVAVPVSLGPTESGKLVSEYMSDSLNISIVPAGIQRFYVHFQKDLEISNIEVYAAIFLADQAGNIYFPGSPTYSSIEYVGWDPLFPVEINMDIISSTAAILPTDRIVIKLYATNLDTVPRTVTFYTEGNQNYSYIRTSTAVVPGATGATGVQGNKGGLLYGYQVGGTGGFFFNNTDASLTTQITFNPKTLEGTSIDSFITSWSEAGTITIQSNTNGDSTYAIFEAGMVITDNVFPTGVVYKVQVTYIAGSTPSALETCVVNFSRTGPKGDACESYTVDYPVSITPGFPGIITFDYIDCQYNPIYDAEVVMGDSITFAAIAGSVTNFSSGGANLNDNGIYHLDGNDGANSGRWDYSGLLSLGMPAGNDFKTNSDDITSITDITINHISSNSVDMSAWLYELYLAYNANSPQTAYLQLTEVNNNTVIGTYLVDSVTDFFGVNDNMNFAVSYVSGTGILNIGAKYTVSWVLNGKKGDSCVNYKIEFPLVVPTPPATIDYIDCNYNVITGLVLVPDEILYINAISGSVTSNFSPTNVTITPLGLVTGKDGANSLRWKYAGVGVSPDAYEFNTTTSDSLGFLTAMKFDLYDLSTEFAYNWFDAIQSGRTVLQIRDTANNTVVGTYNIASDSYNPPDSWNLNLTYVSGGGNLVVGNEYSVSYVINGANGELGNFGGDSVLMKMDTYSYPIPSVGHSGYIGFNGTSPINTTQLQISWSDANGGYIGAWLNVFEQVNNPVKGHLRISVNGSYTDWAFFRVNSAVNSSGRAIVQVSPVSYNGTIDPEDLLVVSFARSGDIGLGYSLQDNTQSLSVGTGTRTLNNTNLSATQTAFNVGTRIRVSAISDPNVWMEGILTAFVGNALQWNSDSFNGSGTYVGWKVSVAGNSGATGLLGPQGFQGFQGPIGATTLGGLNDVSIVGATTGQILSYTYFGPGVNDGLWANDSISSALGYTAADPSTILWDRYVTNTARYFLPPQTGTVHDSFGLPLPLSSAVGTGSSFANAGNVLPYALAYQCAQATSSVAAQYGTALPISLGTLYEWTFERKFQLRTNMLSQQFFCGISSRYSATIPTNQVPMADTMINSIGICKIQGNANLQFIYNDGTGIATLSDCGVNFPAFLAATAYKLTIKKFRGATPIYLTLTKLNTGTGETLDITLVINTGDYNTGTVHYPAAWISNYTSASSTLFWDFGCMLQKSAIY